MKCPDTWQITKATGMKNDEYFQRSASNWKCLLLWEGQDSFILGSVLTGRIDFRMCWEKYFVISCLGRRLKRGNTRKRKICVTFTEGQIRNSAGSLRILRCKPSSILHRPHSLPLDSFSVWSHRSWTWCLLHVLMPESHRMPCPMRLGVKTEIQMSFKKLKVRI